MRIFETNEKVNFVDKSNVFVGYDLRQHCCEKAGWFISTTEEKRIIEQEFNIDTQQYNFDTKYFIENVLEEGDIVLFRLIAKNKLDIYLHLYNCHNGYYGHGFESKIGDQIWKVGTL